jgi:ribonucleoside-diphosphate reductase alpha chain
MDRVTDVSLYPLVEQEHEAKSKRRMGLGVTGLANAIEAIGPKYGTADFVRLESRILETLRDESYRASMMLAQERGAFPLFDAEKYCEGEFINTLPHELQADIHAYGIRNSHLTSIAPTGTISMCADNVSSGIEPVFALRSNRIVNLSDGAHTIESLDYGLATFGVEGKTCDRVTVQEHLDVLVAAAERVDSAVSKTCNVPSDISWSDFKGLYVQAFQRGAKGCTTYRVGGKREGILTAANDNQDVGAACVYDPATGVRSCE